MFLLHIISIKNLSIATKPRVKPLFCYIDEREIKLPGPWDALLELAGAIQKKKTKKKHKEKKKKQLKKKQ